MKKRLFIYSALIILMGLLCLFGVSVFMTYDSNLRIAKDTVTEAAKICASLYDENADTAAFVKAGEGTRITIISAGGKVLADSSPLDLSLTGNHLDRPEVQAALNGTPAAYIRHSDTIGADLIYYAVKANSGNSYVFIRTAVPVARIDAYLFQSLPLLALALLVVAALCFVFSRGMTNRITKPFETIAQKLRLLSAGKYESQPFAKSYEEIDAIVSGIDELAQLLHNNFVSLRDEKSKVEYILNNISDGIFAINEEKGIALINAAALDIFDVTADIVNKKIDYLTYDKTLIQILDDCVAGEKSALLELTLNGRIYLITVKRLPQTRLTMVILSDVTDNRESAKRREEFFANASHELKTPLTAIKGFNELAGLNNKDECIIKYINGIARETERMLSLIGDMLKLSELANTTKISPVPVSLANTVNDVLDTLSTAISEKSLTIEVEGEATVFSEAGHVYELIKNLVENAVRYNNQNGRVSVKVESGKKPPRLSVVDNGIGISPTEQTRIFERFYRVEKGRAQRNGGTGLGLSIVKHICTLYGWELSLKSKLGTGTEIKVTFYTK